MENRSNEYTNEHSSSLSQDRTGQDRGVFYLSIYPLPSLGGPRDMQRKEEKLLLLLVLLLASTTD
jgi:hypothetical protein